MNKLSEFMKKNERNKSTSGHMIVGRGRLDEGDSLLISLCGPRGEHLSRSTYVRCDNKLHLLCGTRHCAFENTIGPPPAAFM